MIYRGKECINSKDVFIWFLLISGKTLPQPDLPQRLQRLQWGQIKPIQLQHGQR